MDAKFYADKIKTEKRYPALQEDIVSDLKIEGILVSRDISCVQEADIFACIDSHVVRMIAESLKNGSLDYETFERVISLRRNSIWYGNFKANYVESKENFIKYKDRYLFIIKRPVMVGSAQNR